MSEFKGFPVDPRALEYYDRRVRASVAENLDLAIEAGKELIEQWTYEEDPHGYCHDRPLLILLVRTAEDWLSLQKFTSA